MSGKSIELTDNIRQDKPVGYLVFCWQPCECDYKVFANLVDAQDMAQDNEVDHYEIEAESVHWPIYPLYAAEPIYLHKD